MTTADTHVLIVDDDPDLRLLARTALSMQTPTVVAGMRISEAGSGDEALARCRDERIDVLVLDMHMPGLSGLDVIRELSGFTAPPCVVAWSADDDALHTATDLGARAAIRKTDLIWLTEAVDDCLTAD